MNRTDLTAAVAEKTGLCRKDAKSAVDAIFDAMQEAIEANEPIQIIGFGSFTVVERPERMGHNPRTNQKIEIPATKVVKFRAGTALKEAVK